MASLTNDKVILDNDVEARWITQGEQFFDWTYLLPKRPTSSITEGRGWVKQYVLRGLYSFQDIDEENDRLQLEDSDFVSLSGGFHFRVSNNWRVLIKVMVINKQDWFDSSGFNVTFPQRIQTFEGSSLGLPFSEAQFVLESGDFVSIDIDSEYSNIAQFKVVMGGQVVFEKGAVDRIVNIDIQDAQKLVLISPTQESVEGAQEEGGQGDLDNDGVVDSLDYDPNDPDVQTKEQYDAKIRAYNEAQDMIDNEEEIIEYSDEDRFGTVIIKKEYPKDPTPILGYIVVVLACLFIIYGRKSNE